VNTSYTHIPDAGTARASCPADNSKKNGQCRLRFPHREYAADTRSRSPASPALKLFDIKCAWFDEHEYCEFFLRTLL
jgi:hypothetical protein